MHPISEVLIEIYTFLQNKEEITFPLTEEQKWKIDSTVKTVNANYFGFNRFPTIEDRAAAYFILIIKDHNVTDGNKRLAVFWLQFYMDAAKKSLALPPNITLDQLAVAVELTKWDIDTFLPVIKSILFSKQ